MKFRSLVIAALAGLAFSLPAKATLLGYAQIDVANIQSNYDPSLGLLTWAGPSNGAFATFNLVARFDNHGSLLGGLFSFTQDSTLLYLGWVESYDLLVRDDFLWTCPSDSVLPSCPPGTQQGVLIETVGLRDLYVSPLLPTWGQRTYATTYDWTTYGSPPFQGSALTRDELFRRGWSAANIIQSHLFSEVPEPGTLALMLLGLGAMAGAGKRRDWAVTRVA